MSPESYVDVLVIGAGPAGLMCASALAMGGTNVRVIDISPVKVAAGQADGIASRTVEVLQSYGLAERLLREGNHVRIGAFYNPGRNGGIECTDRKAIFAAPTVRYPFVITLQQAGIEAVFHDSLKDRGIEIERPKRPSAIVISETEGELSGSLAYIVKVTVERLDAVDDEDRTETIYAKFVVGADGAHSWVRKTLGIEMEGEQTDYNWGVVDAILETNFPDIHNLAVIQSENGSCLLIPREDNKTRLYIQLSETDIINPVTGRVDKKRTSPQELLSAARKIMHPYELSDPKYIEWWTIYTIGQRVASSYAVRDRVFIVGDACHTHSPKGGQGMNAGMNDAHNLAWKIMHVLRGWSSPALLKTYEQERRKYAQDLIDFDKRYATLFSEKPKTSENQADVSHSDISQILCAHMGFVTGTGIRYSSSAIVDPKHQKYAKNLVIGQRMPPQIFVRAADIRPIDIQEVLPSDVRFKVLFFVGNLVPGRINELNFLVEELDKPSSFLRKYSTDGDLSKTFDIITIVAGNKFDVNHLLVPSFLRSHWSKILLDDSDVIGNQGGDAYERFGIDPKQITLVIVRPDGYVGTIVPSTAIIDLENYFGSFMVAQRSTTEGQHHG